MAKRLPNPEQVAESLARTQRIAHMGDWEWEIDTNAVHWSEELYRIYGFQPNEVEPDYDLILRQLHPDSREAFLAAIDAALNKDAPFEMDYKFLRQDGSEATLHTVGEVYRDSEGKPLRMAGIVQDVTSQRLAEGERGESEQKFRAIFDSANDGIIIVNPQTHKFVEANQRICDALGYTREEMLALGVYDIHPRAELPHVLEEFDRQMRGEIVVAPDLPVQRKDGSVFYADIGAASLMLGGQPHAIGVFRDITQRKQAELALRESEERYRVLVETMNEGLGVQDAEGRITYMNRFALEMFGYQAAEIIGKPISTLFDEENLEAFNQQMESRQMGGEERYEVTWKKKDGGRLDTIVSPHPLFDKEGNFAGSFGIFIDITERRRAEKEKERLREQLDQAQKMESVGRLAGGIAHDFNNALQAILGHAQLAMIDAPEGGDLLENLQAVERAAEHSADLTRQLLAFARQQAVEPRVIDLNDTISSIIRMLERLIGEDIAVNWSPEARPALVNIDPGQVNQVLVNLCVNAREAIGGNGRVAIATDRAVLDEAYCENRPGFLPGTYVTLEVFDDGCGMDHEVQKHLFEPFFTTRAIGKGTGLGLATVYGIVKQNEGFINVYSEPGQGSCFKIYLPAVAGSVADEAPAEPAEPQRGSGETILLVEDDIAILKLAAKILANLGYRVIVAATPAEAIREAEKYAGVLDLLITDVVMPGMNGRDLARRLQEMVPGLKCLFMSGYTSDIIANHGVLDEGLHFVQKPFSVETMGEKVRNVLGKE